MATKTELEKELEELKEAHKSLKEEVDLQKLAIGLAVEGEVLLTNETKTDLQALQVFLQKLHRESEWPPVREDIQRWRTLLGTLVE